jgi:hypothetical protein
MTESTPSGLISYRWWCSSATIIAVRSSSVMMAGMCLPTVSALMASWYRSAVARLDACIGDPHDALVEQGSGGTRRRVVRRGGLPRLREPHEEG